jgi:PAS domain S-box-containing protein
MNDARPMFDAAFGASGPGAVLAAAPALIDLLPSGVYACDAAGRLCWHNRRAAELWGRDPKPGDPAERLGGSDGLYRLSGELIRREETALAEALATGCAVDGREAMIERPDGERIVVVEHANPVKDADGQVIGAICCFHDVTEVRREARELRERERGAHALLEALPAAVYATDAEGRITFFNEAAVELAGRRPTLGEDKWCVTWRFYGPDGARIPHDECPMAITLRTGEAVRGLEGVIERPDGVRTVVVPYPTPIFDAAGELAGAVNMLVDVSALKTAETRRDAMHSELNHRIKNTLQMLHGLVAAARREAATDDAKKALAECGRRIGAIGAAQKTLYRESDPNGFSTVEFLEAVCRAAAQSLPDSIAIACEAEPGRLPNDSAAPLALILNELLVNAAEYGRDGDGRSDIMVRLTSDADAFVLSVEDHGPGFDLGEPRRRSSGLGLVKGLAGQIGGRLDVERTPGARCTVRFNDTSRH